MERHTVYLIIALIFVLLFVSGIYKYQLLGDLQTPKVTNEFSVGSVDINNGEPIKCIRRTEDNETNVIYIQGNNVYFEGINTFILTNSDAMGLLKDNVLWIWAANNKEGVKLTFDMKQNWKNDFLRGFNLNNLECEYTDIPEGVFTPPSGVNFLED
jgi:hypothetical protein